MTHTITNTSWWKATAYRLAATLLAALIAIVWPVYSGEISLVTAALTLALTGIVTILTAIVGLPELTGNNVPVWLAILTRTLKTLAQTVLAGVGTAVLVTDVDWLPLISYALTATLLTLLRTLLMSLPETAREGLGTE